jgi:signal peptidase I
LGDRTIGGTRRSARRLAREVRHVMRNRGHRVPATVREAIEARLADLDRAIAQDLEGRKLAAASQAVEAEVSRHAELKRATVTEYVRSLGAAVGVALLIRAFVIEAFKIPTGSMIPTLKVDDHIFVNKFAYGLRIPFTHYRVVELGKPQRGDIVVFEFPGEGEDKGKDFIKRFVAGPGDRVRLTDNRLYVNGEGVPTEVIDQAAPCDDPTFAHCKCVRQRERLGDATYVTQHLAPPPANSGLGCVNSPDWPSVDGSRDGAHDEVAVPAGHYLAMGDNRDNSSDGRYWGFVPEENAKGSALFLWWPPGRWFHGVE